MTHEVQLQLNFFRYSSSFLATLIGIILLMHGAQALSGPLSKPSPNPIDLTIDTLKVSSDTSATQPPSLEDIMKTLKDEFSLTRSLLEKINKKVIPPSRIENIQDEFISNFLWEYIGSRLIAGVLAAVASLSILTKIAVKLRLHKQSQVSGAPPSQTAIKIDAAVNGVMLVIVILFVLILISFLATGGNRLNPTSSSELTAISERLNQIENKLIPATVAEGHSTVNFNPVLFLVTALSLGGILVLALTSDRRQTQLEPAIKLPEMQPTSEAIIARLFTPIVLALIILLLPYPVDALLLPFIVAYLITAFFEILRLYTNPTLMKIVVKHYSLLIYLAHFGVWFGFFNTLKIFLEPVWFVLSQSTFSRESNVPRLIVEFLWSWSTLGLAIIVAIPGWRRVKKETERDAIPTIRKSLEPLQGIEIGKSIA